MKRRVMCLILTVGMMNTGITTVLGDVFNSESTIDSEYIEQSTYLKYPVEGGYIYIDPDNNSIVKCDSTVTQVNIPREVNGFEVIAIDYDAFEGCTELSNIKIPKSIKTCNGNPFKYCEKLKRIEVEKGNPYLYTVDNVLFYRKKVDHDIYKRNLLWCPRDRKGIYAVPEGVEGISEYSFMDCKGITEVKFPDSMSSIEGRAFLNCTGIKEVNFNSVSYIGSYAYECCTSLKKVIIENSINSVSRESFLDCDAIETIILPDFDFLDGGSGSMYTFKYCAGLKNVYCEQGSYADNPEYYPDGVNMIYSSEPYAAEGGNIYINTVSGNVVYSDKSVTNVNIPDYINGVAVKKISPNAFANCIYLTDITFSDNLIEIGDNAFNGCGDLRSIEIPKNVQRIGENAFQDCVRLSEIRLPSRGFKYYKSTFKGCIGIEKIYAYRSSELLELAPEVIYLDTVYTTECGNIMYFDKTTGLITDIINIGTELKIPEKIEGVQVEEIYKYDEFYDNEILEKVTLPEGLKRVGYEMFGYRSNIKSINVPSTLEALSEMAFSYVGIGGELVIPIGIEVIPKFCFNGCKTLIDLKISDNVKIIGAGTFKECTNIEKLEIGKNVTEIGVYAFSGLEILESVNIPKSVDLIGRCSFSDCTNLQTMNIYAKNAIIDESFVSGCNNLKTVYCYKDSTADNPKLYNEDTEIIYFNEEVNVIKGDSSGDGILTAEDVAMLMQKVLNSNYKMPVEDIISDYKVILDVDGDGELTGADVSMIMQKVLNNSYQI